MFLVKLIKVILEMKQKIKKEGKAGIVIVSNVHTLYNTTAWILLLMAIVSKSLFFDKNYLQFFGVLKGFSLIILLSSSLVKKVVYDIECITRVLDLLLELSINSMVITIILTNED